MLNRFFHYNRQIATELSGKGNRSDPFSPLVLLIFGAVCISLSPVFVKMVGVDKLGPTAIGFWRTFIGGATLVVLNVFAGKTLRIERQSFRHAVLAGFVFALDLFVWHRSILYVGAGMSTILGNTQVFFTAILALFLFREKLSLRYSLSVLAAFVGLILLVNVFDSDTIANEKYLLGVALGVATGMSYAIFLTIVKHASRDNSAFSSRVFMAWTSLFTALFMAGMTFIERQPILPPDTESLAVLAMLGIVSQAIGWWVITYAMGKNKASTVALTLLLQPTLATVWGVLFFAEHLGLIQYIGAVIMLCAIYFGSKKNGKR